MNVQKLSRRTALRGLGASIALPWLESMALAADLAKPVGTAAREAVGPKRIAFLYVPNGIHMQAWTPEAVGSNFTLPTTLQPLKPFQDDLLVLSGLAQHNAAALGDGGGDHARSLACFLTGVHPLKTDGANLRAGVSVDQIAAERIGRQTRLSSLELGIERGAQSGNCDSGYSCAYSSNISWRSSSMPMAKEVNPKQVFDRLFSNRTQKGSAAERLKREYYQKSIIDFVQEDAQQLRRKLGMTDRRKIDEYLTAVREIEQRIDRADTQESSTAVNHSRPTGIPEDYREHIRLMFDLMALAFQGDVTRITTFMYANEGSNRPYSHINVSEGHHELSHHGNDPKKHEKIKKINLFHIEQFAYLLGKLKAIREGEKSLLDNTILVYGSGIGDGNRHNHDDLPILVAGRGGGTVQTGRHLKYEKGLPLNNLYLSILDRIGAGVDTLGDSTGKLPDLS
ncbi:MAG: hypothetical protein ABS79_07430 [Planctomycetes bacterium SCN 63-9]|nr:MAG: hypothetical protein ABS79_07430 [Planctomycetes bacterium SCN 63-9]